MYCQVPETARPWKWDPPKIRDVEHRTLPAAGTPGTAEGVPLVGLDGQWNNARVSFMGAEPWWDIRLDLYARIGGNKQWVRSATPRDGVQRISDATMYSIVMGLQGFPCDGWEVWAVPGAGAIASTIVGRFSLQCWGTETGYRANELLFDHGQPNAGDPIPPATAAVIISPTPAHFVELNFHNTNAATRYLQLWDANGLPAGGAQPTIQSIRLLPDQQGTWGVRDFGHNCHNGIVLTQSLTQRTFTADNVSSTMFFSAWYRRP